MKTGSLFGVVGVALLVLLSTASSAFAQSAGGAGVWHPDSFGMAIVSTLVFGGIGILMAILGFKLFDAVTPFNLEKEICEKQNTAVAILCAGMVVGICIVIAAVVL
jgi:hypothetical protein